MSGLTAQFVVLMMFSCSFVLCEGTLNVTAKVGEDATLQCQKVSDNSVTGIAWSRRDLQSDLYVFFFRKNQPLEHYQLPSFRGRVELKDPEMKNGNASVILKNVTVNDTGTYECFVVTHSSGRTKRHNEFRQLVTLTVTESGHTAGHTEERRDEKGGDKEGGDKERGDRNRGNLTAPLIAVAVVICVVGFVGFVLWKRQRRQKQNPTQPAADEAELQTLSPPSSNHCQ